MSNQTDYVVAGLDLYQFTNSWFEGLKDGKGHMYGLLDSGPECSPHFLMGNVAPHAVSEEASDELLLLFGVLALFQKQHRTPEGVLAPDGWEQMWAYVGFAFDHYHEVGPEVTAETLVRHAISGMSGGGLRGNHRMIGSRREISPAKEAAHEQEMAEISQREFRAARLFDPSVDIDGIILTTSLDSPA